MASGCRLRFKFNDKLDHIVVRTRVVGTIAQECRAVLDTGANAVIVVPQLAQRLGLIRLEKQSQVFSLEQQYTAFRVKIPCLLALGYEFQDLEAIVFGLSEHLGADMLIGLKFLKKFSDLHVSFKKSYVELTR